MTPRQLKQTMEGRVAAFQGSMQQVRRVCRDLLLTSAQASNRGISTAAAPLLLYVCTIL